VSVDLCVVSFNTQRLLERQLDVLHSDVADPYGNHGWSLYLADNGSTDGTITFLESICVDSPAYNGKRYQVSAAWNNDNVGYAAACNFLAAQGRGNIIGLLNADVWLTTAHVRAIESAFVDDPGLAILGPKQRNEQGEVVHGGIFGSLDRPVHRGWKEPDPEDVLYRDVVDAVTVSGSAFFIRRDVWNELAGCEIYKDFLKTIGHETSPGAFLPTEMYYEETFASYHAWSHGLKVQYYGPVSIGHTWHGSSPVGSQTHKFMASQQVFRAACDSHGIAHD
jgi:GT2 family glycosyltransferase